MLSSPPGGAPSGSTKLHPDKWFSEYNSRSRLNDINQFSFWADKFIFSYDKINERFGVGSVKYPGLITLYYSILHLIVSSEVIDLNIGPKIKATLPLLHLSW